MQLHQLQPKHKLKKRKRVGRGGKRGTYSGRGMKGQKSRAGHKSEPAIRGLIKKHPKLRGYRNKLNVNSEKSRTVILNLSIIEKQFKDGEKINPEVLVEKKLIKKIGGKMPIVKILGKGELTKKIILEDCQVSETARKAIEKMGGTINQKTKTKKAEKSK